MNKTKNILNIKKTNKKLQWQCKFSTVKQIHKKLNIVWFLFYIIIFLFPFFLNKAI